MGGDRCPLMKFRGGYGREPGGWRILFYMDRVNMYWKGNLDIEKFKGCV